MKLVKAKTKIDNTPPGLPALISDSLCDRLNEQGMVSEIVGEVANDDEMSITVVRQQCAKAVTEASIPIREAAKKAKLNRHNAQLRKTKKPTIPEGFEPTIISLNTTAELEANVESAEMLEETPEIETEVKTSRRKRNKKAGGDNK